MTLQEGGGGERTRSKNQNVIMENVFSRVVNQ